jgi:hypothetical protein
MGQSVAFPMIFGLAIVEIFLLNSWNRWYFTWGIPLFRRKYNNDGVSSLHKWPTASRIECLYTAKGIQFPAITVCELSTTEYAFRHKWFTFGQSRSFPVIRGLLLWDITSGAVIVVGYANWYTILFLALWIWPIVLTNVLVWPVVLANALVSVLVGLFFTTLVGLLYVIQSRCFDEVGKLAIQAWCTGTTTTDTTG